MKAVKIDAKYDGKTLMGEVVYCSACYFGHIDTDSGKEMDEHIDTCDVMTMLIRDWYNSIPEREKFSDLGRWIFRQLHKRTSWRG